MLAGVELEHGEKGRGGEGQRKIWMDGEARVEIL